MIEENEIDVKFKQQGPVCVLATYAIIINYFSCGTINVNEIFKLYQSHFGNLDILIKKKEKKIKPSKFNKMQCDEISEHFHKNCIPTDKRGFDFIREIHDENIIGTNRYCMIDNIFTSKVQINTVHQDLLINSLVNDNKIAMVLFKVSDSQFHALVVWFNEQRREFAIRDPEKSKIRYVNSLNEFLITEYIIFDAYEEEEELEA